MESLNAVSVMRRPRARVGDTRSVSTPKSSKARLADLKHCDHIFLHDVSEMPQYERAPLVGTNLSLAFCPGFLLNGAPVSPHFFRLDSRVVAESARPLLVPSLQSSPGDTIGFAPAPVSMRGSATAIITQLLIAHSRHRTSPRLTANGQDAVRQQPALEAELAATQEQLRLAKADNQALHQRLVDERNGHQALLESAVCFWKDRADEARKQAVANQQQAGGDEPWPPGSARFEAAASTATLGHYPEDLRLWRQQQRTPKRPR
jgi:hypothetical protein